VSACICLIIIVRAGAGIVHLTHTMLRVRRYLYAGELPESTESATEVLFVADKYLALPLVKACIKIIRQSLSDENFCAILNSSKRTPALIELCDAFVCARAESILPSQAFAGLKEEHALRILKLEDLRCEELVVWPLWAQTTSRSTHASGVVHATGHAVHAAVGYAVQATLHSVNAISQVVHGASTCRLSRCAYLWSRFAYR